MGKVKTGIEDLLKKIENYDIDAQWSFDKKSAICF